MSLNIITIMNMIFVTNIIIFTILVIVMNVGNVAPVIFVHFISVE
jgi:hypothetical protein